MLTSQLEAVQASIRGTAYAHFAWLTPDSTPWSPLSRPLAESTVALVSTCGLYRADQHTPFDAWNDLGDPSFREIHIDTPADRLRIAHTHYDHHHAGQDPNAVLPILYFRELARRGVIGQLYPWAFSFMGYLPEPRQLVQEIAPQVAKRLAADGVHAAFLTPCWLLCQQSVGLLARALESVSITTVCVVMNRDITENVKTPRALYVRFPYGAPLGPAGDQATQAAVIGQALALLTGATTPGAIVESDVEWPDWGGKMRISIEFCLAWNYTPRAASMAEALINTFKPLVGGKHPIEELTLIPSGNGRYEVTIDGDLVYSKAATGKHTTNEYIIEQVRSRLRRS